MQRISRIEKRKIAKGWYKWIFVPLILFAAFSLDGWLNVQALQQDLQISTFDQQRRRLEKKLHEMLAEETMLLGIDHLNQMAEHMGFGPPALQQVETLAYREIPRRIPVLDVQPEPGFRVIILNPEPVSPAIPEEITHIAAMPPPVISGDAGMPEHLGGDLPSEQLDTNPAALGPLPEGMTDPSDTELGLEYMLGKL